MSAVTTETAAAVAGAPEGEVVAPAPPRARQTLVASTLAGVGAAATLGAALAAYLVFRQASGGTTEGWIPDGVEIPQVITSTLLATLLMGSVTAQWAVYAVARNDRRNAYLAFGVTILLGVAFVNGQVFVWDRMGIGPGDASPAEPFAVLFYGVTTIMTALVVVAILYLVVMGFRTLAGNYGPGRTEGVSGSVLFWHVIVGCFCAVWALVYTLQ